MKEYIFENDTFDFTFKFAVHKNSNKAKKKLWRIAKKMGYEKEEFYNMLDSSYAFVFGKAFYYVLAMDYKSFDSFDKKSNTIEKIKVLQHECNHIKENILSDISEQKQHRETESTMRISDWCFKKCMNTDFFKKLLK